MPDRLPQWSRVVLKLSGEAFADSTIGYGIDGKVVSRIASEVAYLEVLRLGLKVMDSTAITFCMDNNLPIVVFNLMEPGNIRLALEGEAIGTLVR